MSWCILYIPCIKKLHTFHLAYLYILYSFWSCALWLIINVFCVLAMLKLLCQMFQSAIEDEPTAKQVFNSSNFHDIFHSNVKCIPLQTRLRLSLPYASLIAYPSLESPFFPPKNVRYCSCSPKSASATSGYPSRRASSPWCRTWWACSGSLNV